MIQDMIQPQSAALITNISDADNHWCVYEHRIYVGNNFEEELIFIGVCRLREFMVFPDARRNTEWMKLVKSDAFVVRLIASCAKEATAYRHRAALVAQFRPRCNIHGADLGASRGAVKCVTTGIVYRNASEACRLLAISPSALSNHLASRPGHKTVKGLVFERLMG